MDETVGLGEVAGKVGDPEGDAQVEAEVVVLPFDLRY